jgi:hypothetical protein
MTTFLFAVNCILTKYRISSCALLVCFVFLGCASHPHTALQSPQSPESPGTRIFRIGGGVIAVHDDSDHSQLTTDQIDNWLQTAGHAVTNYLGKYPVARVDINISTSGRHGDQIGGVTNDGRYIQLRLPKGETIDDLNDDWVATHEMFHLAFPVMPDEQKWMNEGLSTYLEPIARARIGTLSQKETWGQFVVGMPQGKPYIATEFIGAGACTGWKRTSKSGSRRTIRNRLLMRCARSLPKAEMAQ